MIVTIDGPAGAGKSTVARLLARRLNWAILDTGAMYRAVGLRCLRNDVDLTDAAAVAQQAKAAEIALQYDPKTPRVLMDGEDVTEAIRTMEASQASGLVARIQPVRDILVVKQRQIGEQIGNLITEGRDQGSVVFPDAELKIFLDASLDRRVERRYLELTVNGRTIDWEEVRLDLCRRDESDCRQWKPLLESGRAIEVDTTHMTLNQVVDRLYELVQQALEANSS
jgi:cytidylate kinase